MPDLVLAQSLTGVELGLDFALSDVLIADLDGQTYVYAISRSGQGIVSMTLEADGTLIPQSVLMVPGFPRAGVENSLTISGTDLLLMSGFFGGAGQGVTLDASYSPTTQIGLDGMSVLVAPVAFSLEGYDLLAAGSPTLEGIALYRRTGADSFETIATLADDESVYLADVAASATLRSGGQAYVLTASAFENGVTLMSVDETGLAVSDVFGTVEGLPLSTPVALATAESGDGAFAVVAGSGSSSLSLLRIKSDGTFRLRDHILDTDDVRLGRVASVDMLSVGDHLFAAASGFDGGVSLFTILPHGRFVHLASFDDDMRVASVSMDVSGTTLSMILSGETEAGLVRIAYDLSDLGAVGSVGTVLDDLLSGGAGDDELAGGAGDDILYDGSGLDTLSGGAGADLFVFADDGATEVITDYQAGIDRLDLSAWGTLTDVGQVNIQSTASGATLAFDGNRLEIRSTSGASLSSDDFTTADILNVDRPDRLPLAMLLDGSDAADLLLGGGGYDTITGGAGADMLFGNGAPDELYGDAGSDTLDGGGGGDTLVGGDGGDSISGGTGGDLIVGDAWDLA